MDAFWAALAHGSVCQSVLLRVLAGTLSKNLIETRLLALRLAALFATFPFPLSLSLSLSRLCICMIFFLFLKRKHMTSSIIIVKVSKIYMPFLYHT